MGFANIAKPLIKLSEKDRAFIWTDESQKAFDQLKQTLTTAPILCYPQIEGKFILDTNASSNAIGSVLSQIQNGRKK